MPIFGSKYTPMSEDAVKISTTGSTSFHYSFSFLPREQRNAIRTVYAFCRRIDDIVDEGPSESPEDIATKRERLQWWRSEVESLYNPAAASVLTKGLSQSLQSVIRRYSIPKQHFLTLIDGCERDLVQHRYATFDELKEYCYAVASTVGLISIEIFGYKNEQTRQYAINLGYALQLTNIIRDLNGDIRRGYIYLPLEDLERFRYSEQDLKNGVYNEAFRALMTFQVQRARHYYHKARTLLVPEEKVTMVAAEIMDAIYYRLLDKIELHDYAVFTKHISVSTVHKLATALRIWLSSKLFIQRLRG